MNTKLKSFWFCFFLFFLNLFSVWAGEIPSIKIPFFEDTITIDGNPAEEVWKNAASTGPFYLLGGKERPTQQSNALIWHNGKKIFVAFICQEENIDKLVANVTQNDRQVWNDDCIELFISPFPDADPYYHFVVNTLGTKYDEKRKDGGLIDLPQWGGPWEAKAKVFTNWYGVEMAIPFSLLGESSSSIWRISFCRENRVNGELSLWPPMVRGFHNPGKFAFLEGIKPSPDNYLIRVEKVEFAFSRKEQNLIKGNLKISLNNQGEKEGGILNLLLSGPDNSLYQEQREISLAPGRIDLSIPLALVKEGDYNLKCEVKEGDELIAFWDGKVEVPCLSFSAILLKPYYRNSIFPSQKISSLLIGMENLSSKSLPAGIIELMDKEGKKMSSLSFSLEAKEKGKEISFSLPDDLEPGEYFIRVSAGNEKIDIPWRKLPPTEGAEVWIDDNNNLVVEGKPIFPLGFYSVSSLVDYQKSGYNFVIDYGFPSKERLSWLEENRAWGFGCTSEFTQPRSSELNQKEIQKVQELISQNPSHIVGWYAADEPEGQMQLDRSAYREALRVLREMDPYRPISVVHNTTAGLSLDRDLADIIMMDPYLDFERNKPSPVRPLEKIAICMDEAVKASGNRKPAWAVLQCFPTGYFSGNPQVARYPTIQEIRAMTYLALIHGAKGIIYWTFDASSHLLDVPSLWSALKEFSSELRYLEPVLLAPYKINWSKTGSVHFLKKEKDGIQYIFAVNTRARKVEVNIPAEGKVFWVLSEGRKVKGDQGKIRDSFSPYETHIYVSQQVPDLPFRQVLEKFREEDAWIGVSGSENLALGWEGARVNASSTNPYRCAFAAIDGGYMSDWLSYNDSSPHLEISLRKKAHIKRIGLVFATRYFLDYRLKYFSDNGWQPLTLKEPKIYHLFWDDEKNRWEKFSPQDKDVSLCPAIGDEYKVDIPETDRFRIEFSPFGHLAEFEAFEE